MLKHNLVILDIADLKKYQENAEESLRMSAADRQYIYGFHDALDGIIHMLEAKGNIVPIQKIVENVVSKAIDDAFVNGCHEEKEEPKGLVNSIEELV